MLLWTNSMPDPGLSLTTSTIFPLQHKRSRRSTTSSAVPEPRLDREEATQRRPGRSRQLRWLRRGFPIPRRQFIYRAVRGGEKTWSGRRRRGRGRQWWPWCHFRVIASHLDVMSHCRRRGWQSRSGTICELEFFSNRAGILPSTFVRFCPAFVCLEDFWYCHIFT